MEKHVLKKTLINLEKNKKNIKISFKAAIIKMVQYYCNKRLMDEC